MIQYLLDTNVAIAIMHGEELVLAKATDPIADGLVGISMPSVGELYFGVHAGDQPQQEQKAVEAFLAALELVDYDEPAAREYGRI